MPQEAYSQFLTPAAPSPVIEDTPSKEPPMTTLIYSMTVSLDGYIAGPDGAIDWSAPDEELMRFRTEQARELTRHLSGRRLYENMLVWETAEQTFTDPLALEFAAIWTAVPRWCPQPA
jgi:dihydrofolate reductase